MATLGLWGASAGSGDNACSAMGTGAVEPGVLVASLGTSATLFGGSAAPVWDPSGTIAPFCDATGQWLPLICTQNCSQPAEEVPTPSARFHSCWASPTFHSSRFLPFYYSVRQETITPPPLRKPTGLVGLHCRSVPRLG